MYIHILSTKSESCDEYSYTITSDKSREELEAIDEDVFNIWLIENCSDKDEDGECYEGIETITTINTNDIIADGHIY